MLCPNTYNIIENFLGQNESTGAQKYKDTRTINLFFKWGTKILPQDWIHSIFIVVFEKIITDKWDD